MYERTAEWERQHLYRVMFDDLGICGCNEPWAAYGLMRDLLVYFAQDHADRDYGDLGRLVGTDGAVHLVLCQLDNADLIEHGGTVAGAWLTDRGRAVLEMARLHEWEDGEDDTEGIDEAGYPHDGGGCDAACWIPQQPAPPEPSTAERMETIRKAAAEQRAAMTPTQRLLDDAALDMMLYGEATMPLYPEAMGAVLGDMLKPAPQSEPAGPPYVHTVSARIACDLEDCCERDEPCDCRCHKPQPHFTVTMLDPVAEGLAGVFETHPDGDEIARVVTGQLARSALAYSEYLTPRPPAPIARFLEGCRLVGSTWIHGRLDGKHTCPKSARG